ncbi:MAG: hypothetical protein ABI689_17025 [Thermoanaerobaculia bacterium]
MVKIALRTLAVFLALTSFQGLAMAQEVDFALFQSTERESSDATLMRFVNLIAGTPVIRVDLDAVTVVSSLNPRDRSAYLDLALLPGTEHHFQIYAVVGGVPQLLIEFPIFFDGYASVTALLMGDLAQVAVEYVPDTPFDVEGYAWLSIFNGAPAFQGFDVVDRATGEVLLYSGTFQNGYSSGIPAGTYDLEIRRHNYSEIVLTLNRVVFESGRKYLLAFCPPLLDGASDSTAFVNGGRFRVSAEWRSFDGTTGAGTRYGGSAESAEFWFFAPSNIELIAKIVDGSPINGNFWVFLGALSNVQFDLTVFDQEERVARQYFNAEGVFASFGDIEAFPAP